MRIPPGDNLPRAVYDSLIAATNDNLPTLHRYFRLRAKMLGVQEMRYYDIYPPLVKGGREYPIDEGIQMMLEAVKLMIMVRMNSDSPAAMRALIVFAFASVASLAVLALVTTPALTSA